MPIYNFMKQFERPILSWQKRSTIRRDRGERNPRPGDTLYLYTNLRTKKPHKLLEVECYSVTPIEIRDDSLYPILLDGRPLYMLERDWLCRVEGIKENSVWLVDWFRKHYGLPFKGVQIMWGPQRTVLITVCCGRETMIKGDVWNVGVCKLNGDFDMALDLDSIYGDGGGCSGGFENDVLRLGRRKFKTLGLWGNGVVRVTLKTANDIFQYLRTLKDTRVDRTKFEPHSGWTVMWDAWKTGASIIPILASEFSE